MERLLKIQSELKCPKNQINKFGNYNYRSCEDILEAVKPLLLKQEIILILSDELQQIGDRFYVKATAILFDKDGKEIIKTEAYAREEETKKGADGSQITGASSSYARKYALNGLFLIDDVKDSDTTNTGEEEKKQNKTKEIKTKEDAENYVINFKSKHQGKTLKYIIENDKSYANWLYKNGDETIIKALNLLKTKKEEIPDYEHGYAPKFNEN